MKRKDLKEGEFYTDGSNKWRKLHEIQLDDDHTYVVYDRIGSILIKSGIHYMGKERCRIETFAKWALYGYSEGTFIDVRKLVRDGGTTE